MERLSGVERLKGGWHATQTRVVGAVGARSALSDLQGQAAASASWSPRFAGMKMEALGFLSKTDKFQFRKLWDCLYFMYHMDGNKDRGKPEAECVSVFCVSLSALFRFARS